MVPARKHLLSRARHTTPAGHPFCRRPRPSAVPLPARTTTSSSSFRVENLRPAASEAPRPPLLRPRAPQLAIAPAPLPLLWPASRAPMPRARVARRAISGHHPSPHVSELCLPPHRLSEPGRSAPTPATCRHSAQAPSSSAAPSASPTNASRASPASRSTASPRARPRAPTRGRVRVSFGAVKAFVPVSA